VQAAINAARMECRADHARQPAVSQAQPRARRSLVMAMTSDTLGPGRIYDAAANILQQKLSQVNGVAGGAGAARSAGCSDRDQSDRACRSMASGLEASGGQRGGQCQLPQRARSRSATGAISALLERPGAHSRDNRPLIIRMAQRFAGTPVDVAESSLETETSDNARAGQRHALGAGKST